MHITHNNRTEPLINFDNSSVAIKQTLNGEYSLSFYIPRTPKNRDCYDLIQEDALITVEGETFVIVSVAELPLSKDVIAVHEFFELNDEQVDQTLADAFHTLEGALAVIFNGLEWSYQLHDTFEMAYLKDVGDDNPIALLQDVLKAFGAEYSVSSVDKVVHISKRVGVDTDYQIRYKHNLVVIDKDIDASDVKTAIRIRYNKREDGTYASTTIYTSPHVDKYRKVKWAKTVEYDTTSAEVAQAYGASQINDTPIITIACEFVHLQRAGYNASDIALGNSFYLIDERLNENELARINEIEYYPYSNKSPKLKLANRVRYMSDIAVQQRQQQLLLDKEAVKQKENYNGVTISEDGGVEVKAEEERSVKIWINAKEGILIKNGEIRKFYVDVDGNVTFDGRLLITKGDGATPMLEAFLDELGGRLLMYDVEGNLNVKMGSEEASDGLRGGVIKMYSDVDLDARVEIGVTDDYYSANSGAGTIRLYDRNKRYSVDISAGGANGGTVGISDENGIFTTGFSRDIGLINFERIATQPWVLSQLDAATDSLANDGKEDLSLAYDGEKIVVRSNGIVVGALAIVPI